MGKRIALGLFLCLWSTAGTLQATQAATQTMQLVTAFTQEPSLSNDREYFEIPTHALAELREELRSWWLRKNQPHDENGLPANAYRRELIQEAMQIIYRDHQEHILRIKEDPSYYGPTYTTLSRRALGDEASELVKSLADNGQIGILTEVHFRQRAGTPAGETQLVPIMWSFSIVIRAGQESFVDLVHISQ